MTSGIDEIAPAGFGWAVTPSDSVELVKHTRALIIGGAGNLSVEMYDPATNKLATVTFTALVEGTIIPIRTKKVLAAGTTATLIVALA